MEQVKDRTEQEASLTGLTAPATAVPATAAPAPAPERVGASSGESFGQVSVPQANSPLVSTPLVNAAVPFTPEVGELIVSDNDDSATVPRVLLDAHDYELSPIAYKVKKALYDCALETPVHDNGLTDEQKREKISACMREIMLTLGLDLNDDSLYKTPLRVGKMFVNEIFSGLDYRNFPDITVIENKMQVDEMIKVKDISFTSTCEHHFMVIDGVAKVAYMPKNKIIGLSKINRIVRFFARRPQVQERLTQQILVALQTILETRNVAVTITATHYCVKARGVQDPTSSTTTTSLGGHFKLNPSSRHEFLTD